MPPRDHPEPAALTNFPLTPSDTGLSCGSTYMRTFFSNRTVFDQRQWEAVFLIHVGICRVQGRLYALF